MVDCVMNVLYLSWRWHMAYSFIVLPRFCLICCGGWWRKRFVLFFRVWNLLFFYHFFSCVHFVYSFFIFMFFLLMWRKQWKNCPFLKLTSYKRSYDLSFITMFIKRKWYWFEEKYRVWKHEKLFWKHAYDNGEAKKMTYWTTQSFMSSENQILSLFSINYTIRLVVQYCIFLICFCFFFNFVLLFVWVWC